MNPHALGAAAMLAVERRTVRNRMLVGAAAAALVHMVVIGGLALAPTPKPKTEADADALAEGSGCATTVSPCRVCRGSAGLPGTNDGKVHARRCPEPMRRLLRRAAVEAPRVEVDLLRAEIVENLGDPAGKLAPDAAPPLKPEEALKADRVAKVRKLVTRSKLGSLLSGDKTDQSRRSKLDSIIGTSAGRRGGDGLVSRKGSTYVREVRLAMQQNFVLPGTVPVWLRKTLQVRVKISRMTATGQVLGYRIVSKSGNDAFDATVNTLLIGYKSGLRRLPEPPPHILTEINSRGLLIILRGG